jgi:hypothetical protein
MYELWLMLNIAWGIALAAWPVLALVFVAWLVLMGAALRRASVGWGRHAFWALQIGGLAAVIVFLTLPSLTRSSLRDVAYWVDWASLAGLALGAGAAAGLFALPIIALWRGAGAASSSSQPSPQGA